MMAKRVAGDPAFVQRVRRAAWVLVIGLWFALATGLVEALRIAVLRLVLDRFVWLPVDAAWMAPLAYLIYFAIPAAILFLVLVAVPRVPVWVAVAVFAFISAFSLSYLFGRHWLDAWALVVLSSGVAIQASRFFRQAENRLRRGLVRSTAVMAMVVLLTAVTMVSVRGIARYRTLAGLAGGAKGPNVVLIILDTVRAASMSLYGYERRTTPNLERLASRATTFERAFATAPWTLPTHATVMTGRWPYEHRADWRTPLSDEQPTLAEAFKQRGYATGGFVANVVYAGSDSGLRRGFIDYMDFRSSGAQFLLSTSLGQWLEGWREGRRPFYPWHDRKNGNEVTRDFLEWQAGVQERPFFAFLNYYDAHLPYRPGRAYREKFKHPNRAIEGYDGAIAFLDDQIGVLFRELESRGVLDNTIVVVTSDHGEMFGEHGLTEHGNSLFLPVLHVPLIVWAPSNQLRGARVQHEVSLRDLPATLLELSGGPADLPGKSWFAAREGRALAEVSQGIRTPPEYPVSRGPMKSILEGGKHYIVHANGEEELYDFVVDPAEKINLAASAEMLPVLEQLRETLQRLTRESRFSRSAVSSDPGDR